MDFERDMRKFSSTHKISTLTVGSTKMRYLLCGNENSEHTILYLVGGAGLLEAWFGHIMQMERQYRILAIDYPVGIESCERVAARIAGVLRLLHINKVVVVGSTLGGYIAQIFARAYPSYTEKLVLYSTGGLTENAINDMMSTCGYIKFFEGLERSVPYKLTRFVDLTHLKSYISNRLPEEERRYLRELFKWLRDPERFTKEISRNILRLEADLANIVPIVPDDLKYLENKVLLILPTDDRLMSSQMQFELIGSMPRPVVKRLSGGHIVSLIKPDRYTNITRKFIECKI